MEQYDDHIWLTVCGQGWAIRKIEHADGAIHFYLWRGYWPDLQYLEICVFDPDWTWYCKAAVQMLQSSPET